MWQHALLLGALLWIVLPSDAADCIGLSVAAANSPLPVVYEAISCQFSGVVRFVKPAGSTPQTWSVAFRNCTFSSDVVIDGASWGPSSTLVFEHVGVDGGITFTGLVTQGASISMSDSVVRGINFQSSRILNTAVALVDSRFTGFNGGPTPCIGLASGARLENSSLQILNCSCTGSAYSLRLRDGLSGSSVDVVNSSFTAIVAIEAGVANGSSVVFQRTKMDDCGISFLPGQWAKRVHFRDGTRVGGLLGLTTVAPTLGNSMPCRVDDVVLTDLTIGRGVLQVPSCLVHSIATFNIVALQLLLKNMTIASPVVVWNVTGAVTFAQLVGPSRGAPILIAVVNVTADVGGITFEGIAFSIGSNVQVTGSRALGVSFVSCPQAASTMVFEDNNFGIGIAYAATSVGNVIFHFSPARNGTSHRYARNVMRSSRAILYWTGSDIDAGELSISDLAAKGDILFTEALLVNSRLVLRNCTSTAPVYRVSGVTVLDWDQPHRGISSLQLLCEGVARCTLSQLQLSNAILLAPFALVRFDIDRRVMLRNVTFNALRFASVQFRGGIELSNVSVLTRIDFFNLTLGMTNSLSGLSTPVLLLDAVKTSVLSLVAVTLSARAMVLISMSTLTAGIRWDSAMFRAASLVLVQHTTLLNGVEYVPPNSALVYIVDSTIADGAVHCYRGVTGKGAAPYSILYHRSQFVNGSTLQIFDCKFDADVTVYPPSSVVDGVVAIANVAATNVAINIEGTAELCVEALKLMGTVSFPCLSKLPCRVHEMVLSNFRVNVLTIAYIVTDRILLVNMTTASILLRNVRTLSQEGISIQRCQVTGNIALDNVSSAPLPAAATGALPPASFVVMVNESSFSVFDVSNCDASGVAWLLIHSTGRAVRLATSKFRHNATFLVSDATMMLGVEYVSSSTTAVLCVDVMWQDGAQLQLRNVSLRSAAVGILFSIGTNFIRESRLLIDNCTIAKVTYGIYFDATSQLLSASGIYVSRSCIAGTVRLMANDSTIHIDAETQLMTPRSLVILCPAAPPCVMRQQAWVNMTLPNLRLERFRFGGPLQLRNVRIVEQLVLVDVDVAGPITLYNCTVGGSTTFMRVRSNGVVVEGARLSGHLAVTEDDAAPVPLHPSSHSWLISSSDLQSLSFDRCNFSGGDRSVLITDVRLSSAWIYAATYTAIVTIQSTLFDHSSLILANVISTSTAPATYAFLFYKTSRLVGGNLWFMNVTKFANAYLGDAVSFIEDGATLLLMGSAVQITALALRSVPRPVLLVIVATSEQTSTTVKELDCDNGKVARPTDVVSGQVPCACLVSTDGATRSAFAAAALGNASGWAADRGILSGPEEVGVVWDAVVAPVAARLRIDECGARPVEGRRTWSSTRSGLLSGTSSVARWSRTPSQPPPPSATALPPPTVASTQVSGTMLASVPPSPTSDLLPSTTGVGLNSTTGSVSSQTDVALDTSTLPPSSPASVAQLLPTSEVAAEATTAASSVATLGSALLQPAAASQSPRLVASGVVALCAFSGDVDAQPSLLDAPIRVSLGTGAMRWFAGASLVSALLFLLLPTVVVLGLRHRSSRGLRQFGVLWVVCTAYFVPTVAGNVTTVAVFASSALEYLVAVACVAALAANVALTCKAVVVDVPRDIEEVVDDADDSRFRAVAPSGVATLVAFKSLVDGARSISRVHVRGYFLEELVAATMSTAIAGARPATTARCRTAGAALLLVASLHLAYACTVRPYFLRLDTAFAIANAVCSVIIAGAALMANVDGLRVAGALTAFGYFSLAQMGLFMLQTVVMTAAWAGERLRQNSRKERRAAPPRHDVPLLEVQEERAIVNPLSKATCA